MSIDTCKKFTLKKLQISLAGIQYTQKSDQNLKLLLTQTLDKLKNAKELCDGKEYNAATLSSKFKTTKVSKLTQIAKDLLDDKNLECYKQDDIKLAADIFLPYLQSMKLVKDLQYQCDLINERIHINEDIYNIYNKQANEYRSLLEEEHPTT